MKKADDGRLCNGSFRKCTCSMIRGISFDFISRSRQKIANDKTRSQFISHFSNEIEGNSTNHRTAKCRLQYWFVVCPMSVAFISQIYDSLAIY